MKRIQGETGYIKGILGVLLLAAIVMIGIKLSTPYYRSYSLGSHTRDFLRTDIGNLEVIKKNVLKDAEELGIPLKESQVDVKLVQKTIKVTAKWQDTVDFWGYYQKTFEFELDEEF
ncbi:MAG: hypothetical protein OHK006_24140 [Thermodesulfovibrionales bacterium]